MNVREEGKNTAIARASEHGGVFFPPRNKFKTVLNIVKLVRNWPDAFELRLWKSRRSLRLLEFRDGLNVIIRGGSNEWNIIYEMLFVGGYRKALNWLASRTEATPLVLDLGANIGMFSMLAAKANIRAKIYSYEPGPPNLRMCRMNLLANQELADRIELIEAAVAGVSGEAQWNFDPASPGGSSLFATDSTPVGVPVKVRLVSFLEATTKMPGDIALVKIDIEGSEWDLLFETPKEAWDRVQAISLELHDDPTGQRTRKAFLDKLVSYGFSFETESVITYFLHR